MAIEWTWEVKVEPIVPKYIHNPPIVLLQCIQIFFPLVFMDTTS